METHIVSIIGGLKGETARFTLTYDGDASEMACEVRGETFVGTAGDYFDALCIVREELERSGLRPFCYGASLNVYPSGMARQMGEGLKAYRLTMGQATQMSDLAEIFDQGPDVTPASVAEQRSFYELWSASPRRSSHA